ncbi:hypothetical protein ACFXAW_22255 [Streptomyces sp. NPDC059445]|uniref:hypothetical protein n=1 Tax=unclassified Streptomyces TaxID=2593676 RepID=UPI00368913F2
MSEHDDRRRPEDEGRPEHEHTQSHAGNGNVNNGPDEQPGIPDMDGAGPEGLGDELALRRLLHQAVQEIEPADGTLEHLRRAVPARRARKRQAVVGMAAAALFMGTAIPAFVHVSNSSGSNPDPSIAANSSQAQGGTSQGKGSDGGSGKDAGSTGTSKGAGDGDKTETPGGTDKDAGGAATGGADPSASASAALPCTADQLGGATGTAAGPDATGAVYGSFTVSNVSTTACTVTSAGTVGTSAQGAADPARIGVATHVGGDAATGLPDPSTEVTSLVLQPGTSYVVKFAWVPSSTCPTAEPSPDPTPTQGATDTGGTTTGSGAEGTAPQLLVEDGTLDGSVVVSSTAATGASASVTVGNACAGTVYHTGILASS